MDQEDLGILMVSDEDESEKSISTTNEMMDIAVEKVGICLDEDEVMGNSNGGRSVPGLIGKTGDEENAEGSEVGSSLQVAASPSRSACGVSNEESCPQSGSSKKRKGADGEPIKREKDLSSSRSVKSEKDNNSKAGRGGDKDEKNDDRDVRMGDVRLLYAYWPLFYHPTLSNGGDTCGFHA